MMSSLRPRRPSGRSACARGRAPGVGLPPLILALAAFVGGALLGAIRLRRMATWMAPLWIGALGIAAFNALFAAANADPAAVEAFRVGPGRGTGPAPIARPAP